METAPERSLEPADGASLRSQLRDLVAMLVLPAVWGDRDTAYILEALLDVLRSMLRLDLAYIRTPASGSDLEVTRMPGPDSGTRPQEIASLVGERAGKHEWSEVLSLTDPATGELLHAVQTAVTVEGGSGVVVAASRRPSFPTSFERFLLQSAVTQAEIALHHARLMTSLHQVLEREQAARSDAEAATRAKNQLNEELEQRVTERTGELTAVNEQLRMEILERKRTEDQLRKSEERWRAVFENSAVGIVFLDFSGRILAANSAYQTMLGCSEEELRTLSFVDITYEEDREHNWQLFTKLLEERGDHFVMEKRYWRKDGRLIWGNIYASLVPGAGSSARFCMAIVEDITERKRSEQRLAAQYAMAGVLAESHSVGDASPQVLQAIGQSMEWEWGALWTVDREAHALRCESIWHAPNVDILEFDAVSREMTFAPGRGLPGGVWQRAEPTWIVDVTQSSEFARAAIAARVGLRGAIAFPILLGGETLGVIEFFSRTVRQPDVQQIETLAAIGSQFGQFIDRKRAEEERTRLAALIEQERRHLSDIVASVPGVVWEAWGEPGANAERLGFVSEPIEQMLGYSTQECLSSPNFWLSVAHEDDRERAWREAAAIFAGGKGGTQQFRLVAKDRRVVWVEAHTAVICDESGRPVGMRGVTMDVTERKRAEDELRKTQSQLAHVARVMTMGELTASIAHEVNQPLAAVVTNGQACLRWLGHEVPRLDEARAAVDRIIRDGNRASEVIRQIRALAKKADLQKARLEINGVIQEVMTLVEREALRHGVSLRTELSSDLPPVLGDRVQLQQVILNLTINGIEAMAPVTDRPREVLIRSDQHEADQVLVAVQDSGIGFDLEQADRLFTAFFTTKPGGMGMGLSISRSIIDAHGGRLWASPNIGAGAIFQFTLPTDREHAS